MAPPVGQSLLTQEHSPKDLLDQMIFDLLPGAFLRLQSVQMGSKDRRHRLIN